MKEYFKDSEVFYTEFYDKDSFGSMITKSSDLIIPSGNSVVVLGFDEIVSDPIRMELYKTSYTFENLNITDIGNLIDNSLESITSSFQKLSAQTLNIIVLGSVPEQISTLLQSFRNGFINIAFIEKKGDVFFSDPVKQLVDNSLFINKAKLLCYQSHLLHSNKLDGLRINQSMRLGEFRNNYKQAEPIIRDIELAFFNMDSIRYSEIPGIKNTSPSGLTSEETCQIMKYLGLNTKNNLISFLGYEPKFDFHSQGAMVISQMIWYYLEGLDQRIIEDVSNSSYIQTFMVDLSDYNLTLRFLQSKKTGRWWVEIPLNEDKESYFMPCSEEDFDKARNNDLSYRIFNELSL
jgi:formiminoglutamase